MLGDVDNRRGMEVLAMDIGAKQRRLLIRQQVDRQRRVVDPDNRSCGGTTMPTGSVRAVVSSSQRLVEPYSNSSTQVQGNPYGSPLHQLQGQRWDKEKCYDHGQEGRRS